MGNKKKYEARLVGWYNLQNKLIVRLLGEKVPLTVKASVDLGFCSVAEIEHHI